MLEKIKQNLSYVLCAGVGLVNFIFFAIPYLTVFADAGFFGSFEKNFNGYKVMGLKKEMEGLKYGFDGAMSQILQIVAFVVGCVLLIWGVIGLLKVFGVLDVVPDKIGNVESKKFSEYGLIAFTAINFLLLIFLIIYTAKNTESEEGITAGVRFSAGLFLTLVYSISSIVALKVLEKKFPASESAGGERVSYVCSKCGKNAKATEKFCSACGGMVEKKVEYPSEYVCSQCGKKVKATDKFCTVCGGAVEKRVIVPSEYVCSQCGKKMKATDKFCTVCGGVVEKKSMEAAQTGAEADAEVTQTDAEAEVEVAVTEE